MNKSDKNVKINFIYSTIYQMLAIITPLITSPYVSRVLGSEGVGAYSYTYSIASIFALFGMLGVNNYGNRTIASCCDDKEERSGIFWNIWFVQLVMTLITVIIYLIYLTCVCEKRFYVVSYIEMLVVISSMLDINWYFFGMEEFKITVTRNIIIKILSVILIITCVKQRADVWLYTLIVVGCAFVSNLVLWPFLKKEVVFCRPDLNEAKKHIKPMLVLFIPVVAISIYRKMDKMMLGSMSTMVQSGYYENVEKIINIPSGVITALGTVMLPRMSYLFAKGESKQSQRYIRLSMEFVCFLSFAMAFGIAGIAQEFAPFFFGEEFQDVGILIIAISPTIVFSAWANVIRTQYLIPNHEDKSYVISVCIGAAVNFVTNYLLISLLGAMGAVIGTVLAELSVMIYQTYVVRKELEISLYLKNGIFYLLAGIVMFITIRLSVKIFTIQSNLILILFEICLGGMCYLLSCMIYNVCRHPKKVKQLLKEVINRI